MSAFTETLQEINARLDLPQPVRSRILLEIAADLEAMEETLRDQGHSVEEARAKAIEHCQLSDDALAQLVELHTSWHRRFLDRFSAQAQTRWERVFLITLLAFVAGTTGPLILSTNVLDVAGAAVWPILAVTLLAVAASGRKFYSLFLKQDHDPQHLGAGLPAILALAGVNLLIGAYGCWLELYRVARTAGVDADGVANSLARWLLSSSATLTVCFLTVILIALLWFVLANRVARIIENDAMSLLN